MPVLRALASRSSPATAAQVYRVSEHGTEAGIRRALERLAGHGVLLSEQIGDRTVYTINHDHVLDGAIRALLRSQDELPRRLREHIADWAIKPESAALYGSAARRDGDADSDIDILVIRPLLSSAARREAWAAQVHLLRGRVRLWTGNHCQVTDRSLTSLRRLVRAAEPIVDQWLSDYVAIGGRPLDELLDAA
jgi:hypothetical protein